MTNTLSKIIIYPLVGIINIIDLIIHFFTRVPHQRLGLPAPNAVLTRPVDKYDLTKGFRSTLFNSELTSLDDPNHNLYDEFSVTAAKFADHKALGTRKKLKIIEEVLPDGKIIKKFLQAPSYEWMKFTDVLKTIDNISNGLLNKGLKSNQNIVINCETRPEWFMSALASMKIKVPIVTLYATLGMEALEFGIQQTDTKFLIISGEQIAKIEKVLPKIKSVTNIIVILDVFYLEQYSKFKEAASLANIEVSTYEELVTFGEKSPIAVDYERPKRDDLAIIMYTSGSTGNPKGAMMSHGNLIVSSRSLRQRMEPFDPLTDVYIGYLPLAHVLELCTEFIMLNGGIPVGYSSPQTITDASTGIVRGEIGDLRTLKPTLMHSVPAVLERLSKAVKLKIKGKSAFFQTLFDTAFERKLRLQKRHGLETKLLDWILFKRVC